MKMTEERLRAVVMGCGILLVVLGLVQAVLKLEVDPKVQQWIGSGLFLVAALAWVQMLQLRRRRAAGERRQEDERPR